MALNSKKGCNLKTKNNQAAKGSLKILNFFKKQSDTDKSKQILLNNSSTINNVDERTSKSVTIILDDEDLDKTQVLNSITHLQNVEISSSPVLSKKRKYKSRAGFGNSDETCDGSLPNQHNPQKKMNLGLPSKPKESCHDVNVKNNSNDISGEHSMCSGTSENPISYNLRSTPKKMDDVNNQHSKDLDDQATFKQNMHKNSPIKCITVKTPEKLLTPEALKIFNTPDKEVETGTFRSPTPRKLFSSHTLPETEDICKKISGSPKNSPQKITEKKSKKTSSARKEQNSNITPEKVSKRTPKKLFDKSPSNLNQFNVKTLQNFVNVAPGKCRKKCSTENDVIILINSGEKKQTSILNYVSPCSSNKSLEAQQKNEATPTKSSQKLTEFCNNSRAKAKLDFSNSISDSSVKMPALQVKNIEHLERPTQMEFGFDDSWDEFIITPDEAVYNLDLTTSQHCKIIQKNVNATNVMLTLESTRSGDQAKCSVEGFWIHLLLNRGDVIHISALKTSNNIWVVNNDFGLIVYEPDFLVSSTSIVSTVFCKRKSVLNERFRGFDPTNRVMVVGVLVHNLLQIVLKKKIKLSSHIEDIMDKLLGSNETVRRLYEIGCSKSELRNEISNFIPRIQDFVNAYVEVGKSRSTIKKDDWKGTINNISDIEENIWCPELGIKGKIDVTIETDNNKLPLELKTGRATVSLEHRGQVILYVMMLNKLGHSTNSGLLLYLREGILREIPVTHKEKRDIMLLRNELAYFLTRKPTLVNEGRKEDGDFFNVLQPPVLPEPITHPSCKQCPYNVICATYLRHENFNFSSNKFLNVINNEQLSYLNDNHLKYFIHWSTLIALEANHSAGSKSLRLIYTLSPEERQTVGKCIINVRVINVGEELNGVYEHTFEKDGNSIDCNFCVCGISESNYVVVSTNSRPAVAAGFVLYIDAKSITVTLDRNLLEKFPNSLFHIDSYDSSSIEVFNMTSLSLLLEDSARASELRSIIVEKKLPVFETKLPKAIAIKGTPILQRLNRVQQRAVLKAIAAKDYFLIKGMPGTGKTATIVALIQLLVELDKSVLITSHTHSAVDNVCSKLISFGVKFMRLGSESRVNKKLLDYTEHALTKNCKTPEELSEAYNKVKVVAVTCLGSGHPLLSKRIMDICIVDESTQVLQSSLIRPLFTAKKFILLGDPDQLPAVIRNREAVQQGMSESLFERLNNQDSTIALNINYRMNKHITHLANVLTYNGELEVGSDAIANASLTLPNKEIFCSAYKEKEWILNVLDDDLEKSIEFLDTGPTWNRTCEVEWLLARDENLQNTQATKQEQNLTNVYEAAVIFALVKALLKAGVPPESIGVIATYTAQVAQLSTLISSYHVDVSTVDQFQGRDKNVIFYSCSKSKDVSKPTDLKFELLEDKRRLTVAITRAKNKLIFVGDLLTLREYSTFSKILSGHVNIISLEDNKQGFYWDSVLNLGDELEP